MNRIISILSLSLFFVACSSKKITMPSSTDYSAKIRLNQIGYYPNAPKKAVITVPVEETSFRVFDLTNKKVVHRGKMSLVKSWPLAKESVRIADFSDVKKNGRYAIFVEGLGYSYPFIIQKNIYQESLKAAMKSYYYQRASFKLDSIYAGKWHRQAGHSDKPVAFHPSTSRSGKVDGSGGWYDAGDYGKYVVNGGFSVGQLLFLYEQYPEAFPDGSLNIPESNNGISDFLDEIKYELDWILNMQDDDGGAFFKITAEKFSGMKMPHEVKLPRFIIGKSTAATLNLAAVCAKASRAFSLVNPNYANQCLEAAMQAWTWAVASPNIPFKNPEGIKTGEYPDQDFRAEFFWTAAELYTSTKDKKYLPYLKQYISDFTFKENESWANFAHHLGAFTLIEHAKDLELTNLIQKNIITTADALVRKTASNDYLQPVDDFNWGSNSDVLNAVMILAHAYRLKSETKYLATAQEITDYIFGKNATGYCFVTGFGSKSPQFIHHRPSVADGIEEPVPGFLSGGPNQYKHDAHAVPYQEDTPPMKCWMDVTKSFASNEVCLNWNAPLVYVLAFLEAEAEK